MRNLFHFFLISFQITYPLNLYICKGIKHTPGSAIDTLYISLASFPTSSPNFWLPSYHFITNERGKNSHEWAFILVWVKYCWFASSCWKSWRLLKNLVGVDNGFNFWVCLTASLAITHLFPDLLEYQSPYKAISWGN